MSICFLDFDGVLHPSHCEVDELFCRLDLLQDWLRRRPGVDVIISSSWREALTLKELTDFFADDLEARVRGVTPVFAQDGWAQFDKERPAPTHVRHLEVLRWLEQNPVPGQRWAALDDQPELYPPGCAELVFIDGKVGLTPLDLDRLDLVLGLTSARPED